MRPDVRFPAETVEHQRTVAEPSTQISPIYEALTSRATHSTCAVIGKQSKARRSASR